MHTEFNAWPRPSLWDILPKSPFQEIKTRWINIKRMISGEAVPRRTRTLENSLLVVWVFLILSMKKSVGCFYSEILTVQQFLFIYTLIILYTYAKMWSYSASLKHIFWQTKHLQNLKIKLRNKTPCASSIV